jgi:hypothetical protein
VKNLVLALILALISSQVWAGCESVGDITHQLICAKWHTLEEPKVGNVTYVPVTYTSDIVLPNKTGTPAVIQIRIQRPDGSYDILMNIGTFDCAAGAHGASTFSRTQWIKYRDSTADGTVFEDVSDKNYRGDSMPANDGSAVEAVANRVCAAVSGYAKAHKNPAPSIQNIATSHTTTPVQASSTFVWTDSKDVFRTRWNNTALSQYLLSSFESSEDKALFSQGHVTYRTVKVSTMNYENVRMYDVYTKNGSIAEALCTQAYLSATGANPATSKTVAHEAVLDFRNSPLGPRGEAGVGNAGFAGYTVAFTADDNNQYDCRVFNQQLQPEVVRHLMLN